METEYVLKFFVFHDAHDDVNVALNCNWNKYNREKVSKNPHRWFRAQKKLISKRIKAPF